MSRNSGYERKSLVRDRCQQVQLNGKHSCRHNVSESNFSPLHSFVRTTKLMQIPTSLDSPALKCQRVCGFFQAASSIPCSCALICGPMRNTIDSIVLRTDAHFTSVAKMHSENIHRNAERRIMNGEKHCAGVVDST